MVRDKTSRTIQRFATVLVIAALTAAVQGVQAHNPVGPQRTVELPTHYERALAEICSPCVKQAYSVATLQIPSMKLPSAARFAAAGPTRAGEIGFEVLRAYQLDRPERQFLAIRVTLSVAPGGGGEMYRVAVGHLDDAELPVLARTLAYLARITTTPSGDADSEITEVDFQGGSLRIGLIRLHGDGIVYVQAGDPAMLALRPVLEMPNTIYMPPSQLPALVATVGEVTAKIKRLQGS